MLSPKCFRVQDLQRFDVGRVTSSICHVAMCSDAVTHATRKLGSSRLGDVDLAEAHQREMTERRNQAALGELDAVGTGQPFGVTRPGELSGTEAERTHHRLQL